jgi:hypothetical protein
MELKPIGCSTQCLSNSADNALARGMLSLQMEVNALAQIHGPAIVVHAKRFPPE